MVARIAAPILTATTVPAKRLEALQLCRAVGKHFSMIAIGKVRRSVASRDRSGKGAQVELDLVRAHYVDEGLGL